MNGPIFLAASVPDPRRHEKYHTTADRTAIRDAVRALASVVLPQRRLVWGGHPAITPLIRVVVESMGITGDDRVVLYQSEAYRDVIPQDNAAFERIRWTPKVERQGDSDEIIRRNSLKLMRETMLNSEKFSAGVFIGGMEGVEDEYEMFRELQPHAIRLPVASTGAAALLIFRSAPHEFPKDLETDFAYPTLFRRLLSNTPQEG